MPHYKLHEEIALSPGSLYYMGILRNSERELVVGVEIYISAF